MGGWLGKRYANMGAEGQPGERYSIMEAEGEPGKRKDVRGISLLI